MMQKIIVVIYVTVFQTTPSVSSTGVYTGSTFGGFVYPLHMVM
jgi:hypothetical protein